MQNLSLAFNSKPRDIEKIPAVMHNPSKAGEWPFIISIAASKENLVCEAENAPEEIQVFSDR